MTAPAPRRLLLLDPLRGVAALWVFAYHLPHAPVWDSQLPTLAALFAMGGRGPAIALFFAISGFVVTGAARHTVSHGKGWSAFLGRRVRRVYPPFWASVLVVALLPFVLEGLSWLKTGQYVPPSSSLTGHRYLEFGFVEWCRHLTLTQAFATVPGASEPSFKFSGLNAVYWTLALEVQFYVVMAAAVACRRHLLTVLGAVTLASLVVVATVDWRLTGLFLPYWPMFAVGVWTDTLFASGLRPSRLPGPYRTAIGLLVAGAIVARLVCAARMGHVPSGWELAAGLALTLVGADALDQHFAFMLERGRTLPRLVCQGAVALGVMSYSIYLLHAKVSLLSYQVLRQVVTAGVLQDVLAVVMTVGLCAPFYFLVERRFIATGARAWASRPPSGRTERRGSGTSPSSPQRALS